MAVTQEMVDALERALLQGTLIVESDGDRITYRSVAEIERALVYARRQLNAQAPTACGPTSDFFVTSFDSDW